MDKTEERKPIKGPCSLGPWRKDGLSAVKPSAIATGFLHLNAGLAKILYAPTERMLERWSAKSRKCHKTDVEEDDGSG
jgi:hypothetical protein